MPSSSVMMAPSCPGLWAPTQQQAVTVIWMVLRGLAGHTCLAERLVGGLVVTAPMVSGVALTLTCTEAGQLVFICRSSWWCT